MPRILLTKLLDNLILVLLTLKNKLILSTERNILLLKRSTSLISNGSMRYLILQCPILVHIDPMISEKLCTKNHLAAAQEMTKLVWFLSKNA